jgi:phenylpropionate dioxygenase-like ring-hydroxylating dioxygenase large terminal subunit
MNINKTAFSPRERTWNPFHAHPPFDEPVEWVRFRFFCEDDIVKESAGPKFAMYFTVTPLSERTCIAWTYVAKDYENIPDEETRRFEDMITWQDVPIVESQRPELLPLDLQAELHLRSDRTATAYRKWLRQLGLTFGTA